MSYRIERLAREHDRHGFDCGEPALNEFLARYARQNEERGLGRTYVAVSEGTKRVVGYYTLAAGSVAFSDIPAHLRRHFPRYPVPVAHLARLASCESARGQRIGEALLIDALTRSLLIADELGIVAIEVRAKTQRTRSFYTKYGFESLEDDPLHQYLPLATAREALER